MRVSMGGLLAAALACTAVGCSASEPEAPAAPQEIRSLGFDDREATYFDRASITKVGDVVTVTTISVFGPDGGVRNGVYRADVTYEIECAGGRGAVVGVKEFDQAGKLTNRQRPPAKWFPVEAGSMGYFLRETACSADRGENKRRVTDLKADARIVFTILASKIRPEYRLLAHRPGAADYFDSASFDRRDDIVRIKVATVSNPRAADYKADEHVVDMAMDVDCASDRVAIITMVSSDASGAETSEGVYTEPEWFATGPQSLGGVLRAAVCEPGAMEMRPLVADYRVDAAEAFRRAR